MVDQLTSRERKSNKEAGEQALQQLSSLFSKSLEQFRERATSGLQLMKTGARDAVTSAIGLVVNLPSDVSTASKAGVELTKSAAKYAVGAAVNLPGAVHEKSIQAAHAIGKAFSDLRGSIVQVQSKRRMGRIENLTSGHLRKLSHSIEQAGISPESKALISDKIATQAADLGQKCQRQPGDVLSFKQYKELRKDQLGGCNRLEGYVKELVKLVQEKEASEKALANVQRAYAKSQEALNNMLAA